MGLHVVVVCTVTAEAAWSKRGRTFTRVNPQVADSIRRGALVPCQDGSHGTAQTSELSADGVWWGVVLWVVFPGSSPGVLGHVVLGWELTGSA